MNISIKLSGRLGNQMFQYAFGYSVSKANKCNLYFNKHNLCNIDKIFRINLQQDIINNKIHIREHKYYIDNCENQYYNLEDKNYYFDGYWQHENYFKKYKQDILKIYNLPQYQISNNDLILHVRRGDYVNHPKVNKTHFYCDLNWYETAISCFNFDRLHIVSDDIEWCSKAFAKYSPIIPNMKELETLGYISSFNNIIISNSSFGWWGAYLSNTDNVVYPKIWWPANPLYETAKKEWKKI